MGVRNVFVSYCIVTSYFELKCHKEKKCHEEKIQQLNESKKNPSMTDYFMNQRCFWEQLYIVPHINAYLWFEVMV